ncbi:MAG TPA: hypothetical protein VF412_07095 [Bdellovibrio sp.]|uniref:hypothetical protein n=1 Tax=Bdellovibrio sp. TaxID=28201 RepID=UPI002F20117C
MDIVLAMSIFFVIVTMIFVAIAVLLPEWMGITGKKAKKIIEMQQEEKHPADHDEKSQDQH